MRKSNKPKNSVAVKTEKVCKKTNNKLQTESAVTLTKEMFSGIIAILAVGFSAYTALFVFIYLM